MDNTAQFLVVSARTFALFALLIIATYTDIAYGRIYNWLVYPAIALGIILAALGQVLDAGRPDIVESAEGLAAGAAIFGFFFLRGWMGAADVKLAAAIGALSGVWFFLWALLFITLAGALIAVAVMIWSGTFGDSMKNSLVFFFRPKKLKEKMEASGQQPVMIPYGLAMAVGTMVAWFAWNVDLW